MYSTYSLVSFYPLLLGRGQLFLNISKLKPEKTLIAASAQKTTLYIYLSCWQKLIEMVKFDPFSGATNFWRFFLLLLREIRYCVYVYQLYPSFNRNFFLLSKPNQLPINTLALPVQLNFGQRKKYSKVFWIYNFFSSPQGDQERENTGLDFTPHARGHDKHSKPKIDLYTKGLDPKSSASIEIPNPNLKIRIYLFFQ